MRVRALETTPAPYANDKYACQAEVEEWERDAAELPQIKQRLRQREQECGELVSPSEAPPASLSLPLSFRVTSLPPSLPLFIDPSRYVFVL